MSEYITKHIYKYEDFIETKASGSFLYDLHYTVKKTPVATMVAYKHPATDELGYGDIIVIIGIANCNPKDSFSKKKGVELALERAKATNSTAEEHTVRIPSKELELFVNRCKRYFHTDRISLACKASVFIFK